MLPLLGPKKTLIILKKKKQLFLRGHGKRNVTESEKNPYRTEDHFAFSSLLVSHTEKKNKSKIEHTHTHTHNLSGKMMSTLF